MAYRDVILADSPVFYSRMDDYWRAGLNSLILDIIGNAQYVLGNAAYSSVAGLITAGGDSNPAFQLTGVGTRFNLSGNAFQTGNGAWSVELWCQFSANPAANTTLFGVGGGSAGQSISITLTTLGKIQIDTNTTALVTSTAALSTGTPHYVAATYDGTTVSLYVDGIAANATATPGTLALTSQFVSFGADPGGARGVSGITVVLDEIAYYTTTLSLARVQAHYLAGRKPYGSGDQYKQNILNALLRGTSLTAIATSYVALYSAEPGDADGSGTELSGSGYSRQAITGNTSDWSAPANSGTNTPYATSNVNAVNFGTATADWLTAGWFSLEDAASASHRILWGQLAAPVKVLNGQNALISIGALAAKEA